MAEQPLTLTPPEHEFLRWFLETVLKDTRVEEHGTRTPSHREYVLHQKELIVGLLNKLQQRPG